MRQFDNRESHFDNEGKFLVGRISFYKADTTTLEIITDKDGVAISNPQFTNNIGQTNQDVFLQNKDYYIVFEKYVGNGNMTTDVNGWQFQYSSWNYFNTMDLSVDSKGIQVINTIADLRKTNPNTIATQNGNKVIILAGYNVAGDKPSVSYVWDDESVEADNGGNVIKNDDIASGRWKLINSFVNGMDIRHFGVFGANSLDIEKWTMAYQIQSASNYCQLIGVPLIFVSNSDYTLTYYCLNNSNVENAIFDNNTRVYSKTGSQSVIYLNDNEAQYLKIVYGNNLTGTYKVYGKKLYSSFYEGSGNNLVEFIPSESITFDYDWYDEATFSDIKVKFEVKNRSKLTFNNCEIESNEKLNPETSLVFNKCRIKESYFDPDKMDESYFGTYLQFTDCESYVTDWKNKNYYALYVASAGETVLDLQNGTVNVDLKFSNDISIINAKINGKVETYGNIDITNSEINYIENHGFKNLNMINSNVTVLPWGNTAFNKVSILDSTLSLHSDYQKLIAYAFTAKSSKVQAKMTSYLNTSYDNCDILNNITIGCGSRADLDFIINNCRISDHVILLNQDFDENEFDEVRIASTTVVSNNVILGSYKDFIDTSYLTFSENSGYALLVNNYNTITNNVGSFAGNIEMKVHTSEQQTNEPYMLVENGKYILKNLKVKDLVYNFTSLDVTLPCDCTIKLGRNNPNNYRYAGQYYVSDGATMPKSFEYITVRGMRMYDDIMVESVSYSGITYTDDTSIVIPYTAIITLTEMK